MVSTTDSALMLHLKSNKSRTAYLSLAAKLTHAFSLSIHQISRASGINLATIVRAFATSYCPEDDVWPLFRGFREVLRARLNILDNARDEIDKILIAQKELPAGSGTHSGETGVSPSRIERIGGIGDMLGNLLRVRKWKFSDVALVAKIPEERIKAIVSGDEATYDETIILARVLHSHELVPRWQADSAAVRDSDARTKKQITLYAQVLLQRVQIELMKAISAAQGVGTDADRLQHVVMHLTKGEKIVGDALSKIDTEISAVSVLDAVNDAMQHETSGDEK